MTAMRSTRDDVDDDELEAEDGAAAPPGVATPDETGGGADSQVAELKDKWLRALA